MIWALNWNICSTSGLLYRPLESHYFQYVCGRFPKQVSNQKPLIKLNRKWLEGLTLWTGWHIRLGRQRESNTFLSQLKNKNNILVWYHHFFITWILGKKRKEIIWSRKPHFSGPKWCLELWKKMESINIYCKTVMPTSWRGREERVFVFLFYYT